MNEIQVEVMIIMVLKWLCCVGLNYKFCNDGGGFN